MALVTYSSYKPGEIGKDRKVFMTSGTYLWLFVTRCSLEGNQVMVGTVKLSKIAPPWDQLVCSEETGVRLMQIILTKILSWDFILSLVYTGSHFIQDSVEVQ